MEEPSWLRHRVTSGLCPTSTIGTACWVRHILINWLHWLKHLHGIQHFYFTVIMFDALVRYDWKKPLSVKFPLSTECLLLWSAICRRKHMLASWDPGVWLPDPAKAVQLGPWGRGSQRHSGEAMVSASSSLGPGQTFDYCCVILLPQAGCGHWSRCRTCVRANMDAIRCFMIQTKPETGTDFLAG